MSDYSLERVKKGPSPFYLKVLFLLVCLVSSAYTYHKIIGFPVPDSFLVGYFVDAAKVEMPEHERTELLKQVIALPANPDFDQTIVHFMEDTMGDVEDGIYLTDEQHEVFDAALTFVGKKDEEALSLDVLQRVVTFGKDVEEENPWFKKRITAIKILTTKQEAIAKAEKEAARKAEALKGEVEASGTIQPD